MHDNGRPLIVTELMDTSLHTQVLRGLTQEECICIEKDVAKALNYLHLFKPVPIVHRDISSANVLLRRRSHNSWIAKLADFGSTRFIEQTMSVNPGAPIYAATEASTNSQTTKVNRKSEAWEGK